MGRSGRVAQWESARFTRERSLVRNQPRPSENIPAKRLFLGSLLRTALSNAARWKHYGDSSIWVRREAFLALGGFRAIPVMEDYDFARKLGRRGRVARLAGPAGTSSRRWRQLGVARTVLSWTTIRCLYLLGVSPERLANLYRPTR